MRAGRVQFAQTKSKKTRAVPISQELNAAIEAHAEDRPPESDRLFEYSYGAFLKALNRANHSLPEGQASHVLRHTFASHFMINGGNILTLQRVLGHASLTPEARASLLLLAVELELCLEPGDLFNPLRAELGLALEPVRGVH